VAILPPVVRSYCWFGGGDPAGRGEEGWEPLNAIYTLPAGCQPQHVVDNIMQFPGRSCWRAVENRPDWLSRCVRRPSARLGGVARSGGPGAGAQRAAHKDVRGSALILDGSPRGELRPAPRPARQLTWIGVTAALPAGERKTRWWRGHPPRWRAVCGTTRSDTPWIHPCRLVAGIHAAYGPRRSCRTPPPFRRRKGLRRRSTRDTSRRSCGHRPRSE
jgi:hypothetical protein